MTIEVDMKTQHFRPSEEEIQDKLNACIKSTVDAIPFSDILDYIGDSQEYAAIQAAFRAGNADEFYSLVFTVAARSVYSQCAEDTELWADLIAVRNRADVDRKYNPFIQTRHTGSDN